MVGFGAVQLLLFVPSRHSGGVRVWVAQAWKRSGLPSAELTCERKAAEESSDVGASLMRRRVRGRRANPRWRSFACTIRSARSPMRFLRAPTCRAVSRRRSSSSSFPTKADNLRHMAMDAPPNDMRSAGADEHERRNRWAMRPRRRLTSQT